MATDLDQAREAYVARDWSRAHAGFEAAQRAAPLSTPDLDRFAVTAMMLGWLDEYFAIRERAYQQQLDAGDIVSAAETAVWIGMQRMAQGEVGPGSGWLGRAGRLVTEDGSDSVPAGYLVLSRTFEAQAAGDLEKAAALAGEAVEAGRRLGCADLVGLALHQQGLLLLEAGQQEQGLALLDEAMLTLSAGDMSPMVTGIVYCGVITGCWSVYELTRAQQWTAAMTEWCDSQSDLGNFTGECKVRRAELKQLQGAWSEAIDELQGVASDDIDLWAAATAAYVRGNLDRLQGRPDSAEQEFAVAARLGFEPQPGLALLRLARGSVQAAAAMLRRSLAETTDSGKRVDLLFAAVETLLALGETKETKEAEELVAELTGRARTMGSTIATALGDQALGAVRLATGHADQALAPLRSALGTWVKVRAPYQEARTRVLIADACRVLGDTESANREVQTARGIFADLGAQPDLARLDGTSDLLTSRELEVLRLLVTGATNKGIATQLVLSERTVDRHVSNIFGKLGVTSRSAATAYAFERQLV